ncbi:MAG TPA: hypothetical protein VFB75_13805 [Burkholderiales bacterium]|nr:hypothetical protein [Burkholderiales bacterium]
MKRERSTIAALLVTMLAACTVLEEPRKGTEAVQEKVIEQEPPPAPAVAQPKPPSPQMLRMMELDGLLSDFERLRRLAPTELAREQESARQAFNQTRSDASRVRFAMALAVPGATGAESGALELLDPLVKNPAVPLHGLAFLLAAYIQEQRRLTSQLQGLQQNVQGLQQNVHALQQKLDALRTLERSLTEREATTPRRR